MTIPVYWHVSENYGDALTPWLVRAISGKEATFCDPRATQEVPLLVTGSILGPDIRRGLVWGAGAAFEKDLDPSTLAPPSDTFRILATRGPLSAAKAREAGHETEVFADPGFLVPFFHKPSSLASRVGILTSWVSHDEARSHFARRMPVMSALGSVDIILANLCSWEVVVTDCLHGVVTAIAYGKPVVWTEFANKILGDGFKFRDLFASIGLEGVRPTPVHAHWSESDFANAAVIYAADGVADRLWDICPLREHELVGSGT